jgi:hypothetical protein
VTVAGPSARIVIGARYNGPLNIANGGYACGVVADALGHPFGPVSVRLQRPVPVETELTATPIAGLDSAAGIALRWGGQTFAIGERAAITIPNPPARPDLAAAADARRRHPGFGVNHPFANCFVCSEDRPDGLHVSAGPLAADGSGDVISTPFEPDDSFATDGVVDRPVIWAALDCPTYPMAAVRADQTCVLGTFRARITRDVLAGERLVVVGWMTAGQGRKHFSASAMLDAAGDVVAAAEAVWIGVPDEYLRPAGAAG